DQDSAAFVERADDVDRVAGARARAARDQDGGLVVRPVPVDACDRVRRLEAAEARALVAVGDRVRVAVTPEADVLDPGHAERDDRKGCERDAHHAASDAASAIALNVPCRIIPGIVLSCVSRSHASPIPKATSSGSASTSPCASPKKTAEPTIAGSTPKRARSRP